MNGISPNVFCAIVSVYERCSNAYPTGVKYGFRIKLAFTNVVVLVDDTSIQKYLCKREMLNRPSNWTVQNNSKGIVALSGQAWKENRRLCMQILADLGYGKESMHIRIQEEAQHLVAKIAEAGGKPVLTREYLQASVLNNLAFYLFGDRHDLDDPRRRQLDALVAGFFESGIDFSIEWLPGWLRRASQRLFPTMRCSAVTRLTEDVTSYMRQEIERHRMMPESQRQRSLVDSFLREIENHEHGDVTMSHLVGNVSDLAVAGTLTTTTTLQWHLVQLALQPSGLQSQLQRELDAAVGRERPPAWEDRGRMPFTVAAIWEMYRWKVATPLGLPREAAEDTYVGKHFVPKGTVILANMWAAHMNPDRWQHPEKFHPARFLKPDGSAPLARPANMFPFGVGKRMCPGEPLAQAAVFLYLTSLLQKYRILPEEGSQLDIGGVFPSKVAAVKLRFLPR
ncbi:cytochrome P450 2J3-like [Dermacentor silvarum]|uniref:cytochrome P450 2J3-like n=1 Tax=Dermacentor silvarum TaxID=543639 RepID=UPI0021007156|nr:cytochrome P450 2J3-like [Dermacentor silvarum]